MRRIKPLNRSDDALCAARYVSPRRRPLSGQEAKIRAVAYALKQAAPEAVAAAAPRMARLIHGPCWLVPIPASDGKVRANLALCKAIAKLVPGARVKTAVARSRAVASSTGLRLRGFHGLKPAQHHLRRAGDRGRPLPVYLVDNVIRTGNTIRAARTALALGVGLVYADARGSLACRIPERHRDRVREVFLAA